jgi:hypothetical protein
MGIYYLLSKFLISYKSLSKIYLKISLTLNKFPSFLNLLLVSFKFKTVNIFSNEILL